MAAQRPDHPPDAAQVRVLALPVLLRQSNSAIRHIPGRCGEPRRDARSAWRAAGVQRPRPHLRTQPGKRSRHAGHVRHRRRRRDAGANGHLQHVRRVCHRLVSQPRQWQHVRNRCRSDLCRPGLSLPQGDGVRNHGHGHANRLYRPHFRCADVHLQGPDRHLYRLLAAARNAKHLGHVHLPRQRGTRDVQVSARRTLADRVHEPDHLQRSRPGQAHLQGDGDRQQVGRPHSRTRDVDRRLHEAEHAGQPRGDGDLSFQRESHLERRDRQPRRDGVRRIPRWGALPIACERDRLHRRGARIVDAPVPGECARHRG